MSKLKVGVLASGRGSNLQALIDAINKKEVDAQIAVVISNKGDAQALDRARKHGINAFFINPSDFEGRDAYERRLVEILDEHEVGLVVLAGYMLIVGKLVLEAYRNRIINIHPALIPCFPGLRAQKQALDFGVQYSGCTVHFVDESLDSGPIILQAVVPVFENDTEELLSKRILEEEHRILPKAVKLFSENRLKVDGRRVRLT